MKRQTDIDAKQYFKKLAPEAIRSQRHLQFTDSDLLDAANAFFLEDSERYVAILEALLRSPDYNDELVDYIEVYDEVSDTVVSFRDSHDNIATAYAKFAYGVQHDTEYAMLDAAHDLAMEYMDQEGREAVEIGLRIVVRFARAFAPPLEWATFTLGFLEMLDAASVLGNRIFKAIAARLQEEGKDAAMAVLEKYLEEDATAEEPTLDVDTALVDEVVDVVSQLPPIDEHPGPLSFSIQPSLRSLLTSEPVEAETLPRPEDAVLELIYLALSPDMAETPESEQALSLLQRWLREGVLPLQELGPCWLEKAQGPWRDFLSDKVCKVGFLTPAELKDLSAKIEANPFLRGNAVGALIEIAQRAPSLEEDIKAWMRYLLTRPESREHPEEEILLAIIISDILDADWQDFLPEIEAAFRDDVVAPKFLQPEDVGDIWGVALDVAEAKSPPEKGEYLLLRCTECGRERFHFVRKVLIDIGTLERKIEGWPTPYSPYIMDHEIVCPKCGARDAYEVDALHATKLMALAFPEWELPEDTEDENDLLTAMLITAARMSSDALEVYPMRMASKDGKLIHPLALRDRYLQNIKKNPKDPANYVALANIYKNLFREEDALAMARKAYELAPDNREVILLRAMAEHDAGDPDIARQLYARIIEEMPRSGWGFGEAFEDAVTAREGLQALKQNRPSPWTRGVSEQMQSFSSSSQRRRKKTRRKKKRKKKKGRRR